MIAPWLANYWAQGVQALHQNRLPHALLISGSPGLGKQDFAVALAKKILCSAALMEACGDCHSCQWFAAQSHPDFSVICPEAEKKQIGVGQIRELTEALTRTGYGRYQVVIIHPAEAMNRAAANALLKTLEEPNGQVILLLVCDHPASLLPTIRSRCQEWRVALPTSDVVLPWLLAQLAEVDRETEATLAQASTVVGKRGTVGAQATAVVGKAGSAKPRPAVSVKHPALAELLALADGLPLRALRLAQSGEWQQYQLIATEFIDVLSGKMTALKAAEVWAKQSASQVLTIIATLLQDMIRLQTGLTVTQLQHTHRAAELQLLSQRYTLPQCWALLEGIQLAKRRTMTSANPNVQLLLESVLIAFMTGKVSTAG